MNKILQTFLMDVLTVFYLPCGFALLLAVLFLFFYLYAFRPEQAGHGIKAGLQAWWQMFRTSPFFRKLFFLAFYTGIVLFATLLNREFYPDPLDNLMGDWWFDVDEEGELSTRWLENLFMLLPFTFLMLWTFDKRLVKGPAFRHTLWASLKIACLTSLLIELLQLILHVGTFQLSDLCYNTIGGALGGLLCWPLIREKTGAQSRRAPCDADRAQSR